MAQLTIEQKKAFHTENKTYYFDNGFLKGLTDFNTLVEERIAKMDRIEADLWKKGESQRRAYYVGKIKNLTSHLVTEIINFRSFPRPKDCSEAEKRLRKNSLERLTMMQIDYAIILRYSTEIAHKMGYLALADKILIKFK